MFNPPKKNILIYYKTLINSINNFIVNMHTKIVKQNNASAIIKIEIYLNIISELVYLYADGSTNISFDDNHIKGLDTEMDYFEKCLSQNFKYLPIQFVAHGDGLLIQDNVVNIYEIKSSYLKEDAKKFKDDSLIKNFNSAVYSDRIRSFVDSTRYTVVKTFIWYNQINYNSYNYRTKIFKNTEPVNSRSSNAIHRRVPSSYSEKTKEPMEDEDWSTVINKKRR